MKFEFRFNFNLINSVKFSVLIIFFLIPEFLIKVNTTEIVLLTKNKTLIEKNFKTEEKNPDNIKLSENNNFNQIIEKFDKNLSYNNNNNKILNDKIESVITTDSEREELNVSDEIKFYEKFKPGKHDKDRFKYGHFKWPRRNKTTTEPPPPPTPPETTTSRAAFTSPTIDSFYSKEESSTVIEPIVIDESPMTTNTNRCLLESAQNFLSSWLAVNGTLIHTRRVMGKRSLN